MYIYFFAVCTQGGCLGTVCTQGGGLGTVCTQGGGLGTINVPSQTAPASSKWTQLWLPQPLNGQRSRLCSLPVHMTSSIYIGPVPAPNSACVDGRLAPLKPSCLHATYMREREGGEREREREEGRGERGREGRERKGGEREREEGRGERGREGRERKGGRERK